MTVQSIFSKVTKAAVALPIVAAGLAFNVGSAEAGALIGSFQIDNNDTLINLTKNEIDFVHPDYDPDGFIALKAQTQSFVGIETAFIKDLIPIDLAPIENFFLFDDGSSFDVVQNAGLKVENSNPFATGLVDLTVALAGIFESSTGEKSQGVANITFQFGEQGLTANKFITDLNNGREFKNLTLSGTAIAIAEVVDVPEPATILGLLAVSGLAGTAIRKRKEEADA
ncbi:MAG: PEP-CTERM sorting domain-containing protein [Cyanobacteria bacterium SBLK]|nr:PEP-CTERM sorting domain-containing protein [Cyanobacteria bacterium SBLK]